MPSPEQLLDPEPFDLGVQELPEEPDTYRTTDSEIPCSELRFAAAIWFVLMSVAGWRSC
jgi:hypothetical protein